MAALFLPCPGGVEALLTAEVMRITGITAEPTRGGVWVQGDERTAMQLNLESRLATRVLWPLADGYYRDEHDLYDLARELVHLPRRRDNAEHHPAGEMSEPSKRGEGVEHPARLTPATARVKTS